MPPIALRSGRTRVPRLGRRNIRAPHVAVGGTREDGIHALTRDARVGRRDSPRVAAARRVAIATTTVAKTATAAAPATMTGSNETPGSGSIRRAFPIGHAVETATANTAATIAAAPPTTAPSNAPAVARSRRV